MPLQRGHVRDRLRMCLQEVRQDRVQLEAFLSRVSPGIHFYSSFGKEVGNGSGAGGVATIFPAWGIYSMGFQGATPH